MRRHIPTLSLLGAVFLLGCQAPTAPEAQPTVGLQPTVFMVAVRALGTVVSVNRAENHGVIQREDDGSNTLYQFNVTSVLPRVGEFVGFTIDPENSRHATNLGFCRPPACDP